MQMESSGVSTSGSDTYSHDGSNHSDTDNDDYIVSSDSSCFSLDNSDEV